MQRLLLLLLLCAISRPGVSQNVSVVDTAPSEGAAGVALATTVRFTFSQPVDPVAVQWALDVIPDDRIDINDVDVSSDGMTFSLSVTHQPGTDYTWLLQETQTFDSATLEPFVLRYTTASSISPHSVSGRAVLVEGAAAGKAAAPPPGVLNLPFLPRRTSFVLSAPREEPSTTERFSDAAVRRLGKRLQAAAKLAADVRGTYVFLVDGHPQEDPDAQPVGVTLVTEADGSYVLPHVRPGIYWPAAIKLEAGSDDDFLIGGYIGFYDTNGDGNADSIEVDDGNVSGVDIYLAGIASYMRTAGELEATAWIHAEAEADDQFLFAIEGAPVDDMGRSLDWSYHFYSPSRNTETSVYVSLLGTGVDVDEYRRRIDPVALAAQRVDSDLAVQVALANGGAEFRAGHEVSFVIATAGPASLDFGQGVGTDDPAWSIAFLGFSETSFEYLVVYVDLLTGDFIGLERSAPPATLHSHVDAVVAVAAEYGDDFRMTSLRAFDVGPDGRSQSWQFELYSVSADALLLISISPFSGTDVYLLEDVEGRDKRFLPPDFVDTDVVMAGALEAGGAALFDENDFVFVTLEGTFTGNRFPELEDRAAFIVDFTAFQEEGIASLFVVMDMESGVVLHTARGRPTAAEGPAGVPEDFELLPSYPNPFNPETTIPFRLRHGGEVSLRIFDAAGRQVAVLLDQSLSAGEHAVRWNADREPSGIYFSRLTSEGRTQTRPMLLVR